MTLSSRLDFRVEPGGSLTGELSLPGDKSISHRALMMSAIADGTTHIEGFLAGEDTLATATALQAMGVDIEFHDDTSLSVKGVGHYGLKKPEGDLDLGNSGTSTRLLAGILAGAGVECVIRGDASLMTRPMKRIVEPLQKMGASISASELGTLPLGIKPHDKISAIDYELPVASAQLKSCLLLAALYAEGKTRITEPTASRDHTERMLSAFGVQLEQSALSVALEGGQCLKACNVSVPADISSAAFFMVGAAISEGSDLLLKQIGINPTREAVITILQQMGADIKLSNQGNMAGEPVADIRVKAEPLHGIEIPSSLVAIAIDEFPAIMIAAAVANGKTTLRGAEELRLKESDRIKAIAEGLSNIGITVEELDDGLVVQGGEIQGGRVNSFTDHRIAMAFSMAALVAKEAITVEDCANVATSFPNFVELAKAAGLKIVREEN